MGGYALAARARKSRTQARADKRMYAHVSGKKEKIMNLSNLLWPMDPSIKIGGLEIHAYAMIIVCGMVAAFFIITALFRRRNMSKDLFLTFFVIGLPVAIITTRLFYCITDG